LAASVIGPYNFLTPKL